MKICCVVLNYFGHEDTITCVQALVDQNDLEKIIIVENSVNSIELSILKDVFKNNRQVEILTPSQNLGFSGGVNLAINSVIDSRFDAFLLLNNDTLVPPNTLTNLANDLISNGFDLVAPIIYCYPEKHKIWAKGYYYNRFLGIITQRNISFVPGTLFYLSGCCILIHRKVFKYIGLLDTSFFMYGEDVEFCFRALQKGFRIGIIEKANIYHKRNVSSQFNSLFYEYHINRCHFILCKKLFNNKYMQQLSFAVKILCLGIRALYRGHKYKNRNAVLGYKHALCESTKRKIFLSVSSSFQVESKGNTR